MCRHDSVPQLERVGASPLWRLLARPRRRRKAVRVAAASGWLILWIGLHPSPAHAQEPPRLSFPVACVPRATCFLQHHVDIDPGPDARDFRCGTSTYDGHSGIDIRLLSVAQARTGVAVLAAAPGIVRRVRDGMEDAFARDTGMTRQSPVASGNAVVIDHGGGWTTAYCHMRRGSVVVREGDAVERGGKLGEVGWSGLTDFAHLHMDVRKDGRIVDPFTGGGQTGTCQPQARGGGLWDASLADALAYRNGEIIEARFTQDDPVNALLEHDHDRLAAPTTSSARLVFYARIINFRAGDRVRFSVDGPSGFTQRGETEPFPRNRQIDVIAISRARRAPAWPAGTYAGLVELMRGGDVVDSRRAEMILR